MLLTGFYPSQKSFWSCTHVNSSSKYTLHINLHILLIILFKTSLKIQKSSKSIKYIKSSQENMIEFLENYFISITFEFRLESDLQVNP